LKLGHACLIFTSEKPLCIIASLIISFISANFIESVVFAKLHQAFFAISIGLKGIFLFHSGVVLVFAHIGVVGLACHVVKA
jgi:hypothetical protein